MTQNQIWPENILGATHYAMHRKGEWDFKAVDPRKVDAVMSKTAGADYLKGLDVLTCDLAYGRDALPDHPESEDLKHEAPMVFILTHGGRRWLVSRAGGYTYARYVLQLKP